MKLLSIIVFLLGPWLCQVVRSDEVYDKLVNEFEIAQDAWYAQIQKAEAAMENRDEPLDMSKLPPRPMHTFLKRFQQYADKHAGRPEAIPALAWIMGAGAEPQKESLARTALTRLIEDHAWQPEIKDILPDLRWASYSWALHIAGKDKLVAFYEKIIDRNKNEEAVAGATFNLAFTFYQASQREDENLDDKTRLTDKKQAEKLFRELTKLYPNTETAKEAKGYIFETLNLQVGMVAPGFVGKDAAGKEIRLSQFRGQVVVLNFWGFWCGPCRSMIPHEREMVKRFADKPFTLLGIMSDKSRSAMKKALDDEKIAWPNIYDGPRGEGEIATRWNVQTMPMIYILDQAGKIRYRSHDLRGQEMEKAVAALLEENPEK